ncbi:hypothetical protein S245_009091, partial [Arachis hypogaea]
NMQTAVGVFGGEAYTDGITAPPLINDNVGDSGLPIISSLNCPPFIAVEQCREHLISFGGSFTHRPSYLWPSTCSLKQNIEFESIDGREKLALGRFTSIVDRPGLIQIIVSTTRTKYMTFLRCIWCSLWKRKEKEIAVVSQRFS